MILLTFDVFLFVHRLRASAMLTVGGYLLSYSVRSIFYAFYFKSRITFVVPHALLVLSTDSNPVLKALFITDYSSFLRTPRLWENMILNYFVDCTLIRRLFLFSIRQRNPYTKSSGLNA